MIAKFREPVNAVTHFVAAALSMIGMLFLIFFGWGSTQKIWMFTIYGISLVLMFIASGVYHMVNAKESILLKLRKFDHSAIYLLIAGTYTPICLYFFKGFWQTGLIIIVWSFAIIGITIKLFIIKAPRWITAGVYLIMGWLAIMGVQEIIQRMPPASITWLVLGGLFYTIGAIIYITKRMDFYPGIFGFHEVWHIFVMLGAFCHYIVILRYIALA